MMILHGSISGPGYTLIPRFSAVILTVERIAEERLLIAEYQPWSLFAMGANPDDLRREVGEQILMLWQEYALADDAALSPAARRVKRRLLADWKS